MTDSVRFKSEIWIMAHIRNAFAQGATACVARRGDPDAGAIFIRVNRLDGTAQLYAPSWAGAQGERRWAARAAGQALPEADVDTMTTQATKIDPDLWIIEIDDRRGRAFLDDALTND